MLWQTCLPQNTSVSTPKQTKNVKGHFFCHSSRRVPEHFQSYRCTAKLAHCNTWMPSFCLHLLKSFRQRLQNTFSKSNAPCVQLLLMPTRPFLDGCCLIGACFLGFLHSSSSSVLCSHLSMTASISNLPYLKMANFHKALNAKSMFIDLKTFLTTQDRPCISAPEMT